MSETRTIKMNINLKGFLENVGNDINSANEKIIELYREVNGCDPYISCDDCEEQCGVDLYGDTYNIACKILMGRICDVANYTEEKGYKDVTDMMINYFGLENQKTEEDAI